MKRLFNFISVVLSAFIWSSGFSYANPTVMDSQFEGQVAEESDSIVALILAKYMAQVFTEELITERNGKIVPYTVERGESWKSIARQCRVDESMLKALNPFDAECLTGMEILVPSFPVSESKVAPDHFVKDRIRQALQREEAGNLKEAVKIYTSIIKEHPSLDARYLRGRAYYRMHKLKQATADFCYVAQNDKDNSFPDAKDIYLQVSEEWEQYKEERTQKWLTIGLGVLDAGLRVANEVMQHKYGNERTNSFLSGTGYAGVSGVSKGGYSNYSLPSSGMNSASYGSSAATSYYANGIQWPASLDPTRYFTPDSMKAEVTFDAWGNPMYSFPGIADAMMKMQRDFNMDMSGSSTLFSGTAMSNALLGQLNRQNQLVAQNANYIANPHYADSFENNNSGDNSTGSGNTNTKDGPSPKCIYCEGTGWVKKSQMGVATLGQHLSKKECKICGYKWDPGLEVHTCEKCTHCQK